MDNDASFAHTSYRTIASPVTTTLIEKKSRFLSFLTPIESEAQAQAHLADIRKEHWSANHHCYAYRLLDGTERASDDGEPSGTAGRPMLHVLTEQQLVGVLAVVTRYFGGTLLGAGGLVRAYSGAVAEAVKSAQVVTFAAHDKYVFPLSYADFEKLQKKIYSEHTWRVEVDYAEVVKMTLIAPETEAERLREEIASMTRSDACREPLERLWLPLKA